MDRKEYLELLIELRDGYGEDIPEEIVDSRSGLKVKARTGWFTSIHLFIQTGINRGYLQDDLRQSNEEFIELVRNINHGKRTSRGEINLGNSLLDQAITQLRSTRI